jgi:hypothetical protein
VKADIQTGLFNDAFLNCVGYMASNGRVTVNDEFERVWKKAVCISRCCITAFASMRLEHDNLYPSRIHAGVLTTR